MQGKTLFEVAIPKDHNDKAHHQSQRGPVRVASARRGPVRVASARRGLVKKAWQLLQGAQFVQRVVEMTRGLVDRQKFVLQFGQPFDFTTIQRIS